MTEPIAPPAATAPPAVAAASPAGDVHALPGRWIAVGAMVLAGLCAAAVMYAWNTQQRVKGLEQQLVKRQEDSGAQAAEAQMLARQAQDNSRDAAAKVALLEARVAEVALQRSQLEELIQAMSRSRDENVLADVEASIRVALQHAAITGSAEPLAIALKQAEERLARQNQPRLDGVRRAVVQDLERVRAAGAVDVSTLAIRLDEVVRMVDELPLLSAPQPQRGAARPAVRPPVPASNGSPTAESACQSAHRTLFTAAASLSGAFARAIRCGKPNSAAVRLPFFWLQLSHASVRFDTRSEPPRALGWNIQALAHTQWVFGFLMWHGQ